jgi:tRNA(Arg) A34 adenosine deaminase TadA
VPLLGARATTLNAGENFRITFKNSRYGSLFLYNVCVDPRLNHSVNVRSGVNAQEAEEQLKKFFQTKRG